MITGIQKPLTTNTQNPRKVHFVLQTVRFVTKNKGFILSVLRVSAVSFCFGCGFAAPCVSWLKLFLAADDAAAVAEAEAAGAAAEDHFISVFQEPARFALRQ